MTGSGSNAPRFGKERFTTQKTLFALSLGFAAAAFAVQQAQGQTARCMTRAQAVALLTTQELQTRRALGLDQRGIMELYASARTGRWTLVLTRPDGMTCILAGGDAFTADAGPAPDGPRA
ncbi:MAG: hypothetical protein ACPGID_04860 [Rubricella sp.]